MTGQVLSVALLIEEIGFRGYRLKDLAPLTAWGSSSRLWFGPALAWWRLRATVLALMGRCPGWGVIRRGEGILERPSEALAALTR